MLMATTELKNNYWITKLWHNNMRYDIVPNAHQPGFSTRKEAMKAIEHHFLLES